MRLPNFLYLGAAKAGSTWIYEALKAHPQVFVPPAKDTAYFSDFFDRGIDWYANFFDGATSKHLAVGEVAVTYLLKPDTLRRIGEQLPRIRVLVCVRNPIERAWSAHRWLVRNNRTSYSFSDEIRKSADESRWVLGAGQYATCLDNLDCYVESDHKLILVFDDLQNDPVAFARQLYDALGVDPTFDFEKASKNFLPASTPRIKWISSAVKRGAIKARQMGLANLVGHIKSSSWLQRSLFKPVEKHSGPSMSKVDWQYLADLYEPDIRYLEKRLDRNLRHWLIPPA